MGPPPKPLPERAYASLASLNEKQRTSYVTSAPARAVGWAQHGPRVLRPGRPSLVSYVRGQARNRG
jgi:hypothetical protein